MGCGLKRDSPIWRKQEPAGGQQREHRDCANDRVRPRSLDAGISAWMGDATTREHRASDYPEQRWNEHRGRGERHVADRRNPAALTGAQSLLSRDRVGDEEHGGASHQASKQNNRTKAVRATCDESADGSTHSHAKGEKNAVGYTGDVDRAIRQGHLELTCAW